MKSVKTWLSSILLGVLISALGFLLAAVLDGCANTVTPPVATARVASFDGMNQNSGVVSLVTNQLGEIEGAIITPHARDRYNALMAEYGPTWLISAPDAGLTAWTNGLWFIDDQHLDYFITANRWWKNAVPATNAVPAAAGK